MHAPRTPIAPGEVTTGASPLLLPALAFANFAIGMGAFVVIGTLSPIAAGLGMTHTQAGLVMSLYAVAYAIASPLIIAGTGRLPRRTVVTVGMSVFLVGTLACALAPGPVPLLLGRALAACGAGLVTPVGAAIAVAVSPADRRGAALASVFLGLTVAQVAGVPLGSFLGYTVGWRAAFWLVLASGAVALFGILVFVPRGIRTPVATLRSLGATLASPALMAAILITVSMMSAAYILFTYFAPFLEDRMGYGRNGVTAILVVYGAGAVTGSFVGGRLSDRLGPTRALLLLTLLQAIVLPLFSFLPLPSPAVALLAFVWGLIGWGFMVPQQSRLVALAPERGNITLALNASAIFIGAAIGSALGGALIANLGFAALGWAAGLGALAVLANIALSVRLAAALR